MSAELPGVLREAHTIVTEQLTRLRALAETTRRSANELSAEMRQAERQLDEAIIQRQITLDRGGRAQPALTQREAVLRARCDQLARALNDNQHALKQLGQLIRQIEMSSGVLMNTSNGSPDPWALALRAQVIQGREEERVRLAREVHDGPAQVLANALMLLETCATLVQQADVARLTTMLDRMREAIRSGLLEVRRFIADLRPGEIERNGLVGALGEYLRGYANAYNAQVSIDAETIPSLPAEVEIVLYRIAQESLQNAHKYARGAPVTVRLGVQGRQLYLSIRDEGPGFDPREVVRRAGRSNWGLTSMRERAELIGARFTVISSPGHGTEVAVALPLSG